MGLGDEALAPCALDAAGHDAVEGDHPPSTAPTTAHPLKQLPSHPVTTHLMPLEMTRLRVASTVSCTAAVQFIAPLLVT